MNLGQKIKSYRELEGLSLRQLAKRTTLGASQIDRIERGETIPTIGTAEKLLTYFGRQLAITEIPTIKKMKDLIKARLEVIGDCQIEVLHIEELTEDAVLATFRFYPRAGEEAGNTDGISTAIYYSSDDYLYHQQDWQGGRPESLKEIREFTWLSQDGREAVILKDLPAILF